MHSLQNFDYNGKTIQRRDDGYLNGSQMCVANGKLFSDWRRLKSTNAYLAEASEAMGIPIGELVEFQNGMQTWVHPSVAISLARWISPRFAVWCDTHIFNLMETGSASLVTTPQTYLEALKALVAAEEERQLLEAEKAILVQANQQLSETVDELFDYSNIIRVAKYNNCSEKQFTWHRLKAVSLRLGLEIKKVPCPRFSQKNLYSHDAWRVAYPGVKLPETTTLVIQGDRTFPNTSSRKTWTK